MLRQRAPWLLAVIAAVATPAVADPLESAYGVFFMPLPGWGPLLGVAVYAYWLRRTAETPSLYVSAPQPEVES